MQQENIFILLAQMLFAVFGACVKWLNAQMHSPQTAFVLLVSAVSAAFAGGLCGFCVRALHLPEELGYALAGIAGYQGVQFIDRISRLIINRYFPEEADLQAKASQAIIKSGQNDTPKPAEDP